MLRHLGGTTLAQRNNQEIIFLVHEFIQLPMELLQRLPVEPATKDA
jgi:hypothetical protein